MNMSPECRECGNRVKFVHRSEESEVCYYNDDIGTHDEDNECRVCGAHIADPHDPYCEIGGES